MKDHFKDAAFDPDAYKHIELVMAAAIAAAIEECATAADEVSERHDRISGGLVAPELDYEIGRRDGASETAHKIRASLR